METESRQKKADHTHHQLFTESNTPSKHERWLYLAWQGREEDNELLVKFSFSLSIYRTQINWSEAHFYIFAIVDSACYSSQGLECCDPQLPLATRVTAHGLWVPGPTALMVYQLSKWPGPVVPHLEVFTAFYLSCTFIIPTAAPCCL